MAFPSICSGRTVPRGTECSIFCDPGYILTGSEMFMDCTQDGTWTVDTTGAICQGLLIILIYYKGTAPQTKLVLPQNCALLTFSIW